MGKTRAILVFKFPIQCLKSMPLLIQLGPERAKEMLRVTILDWCFFFLVAKTTNCIIWELERIGGERRRLRNTMVVCE